MNNFIFKTLLLLLTNVFWFWYTITCIDLWLRYWRVSESTWFIFVFLCSLFCVVRCSLLLLFLCCVHSVIDHLAVHSVIRIELLLLSSPTIIIMLLIWLWSCSFLGYVWNLKASWVVLYVKRKTRRSVPSLINCRRIFKKWTWKITQGRPHCYLY